MAGYQCPWFAGVSDEMTAGFVRQKGVWTHTGRSEGYILANRPGKLFWNIHGYNMTLTYMTPYDNVKVWVVTGGSIEDRTIVSPNTTPSDPKGQTDQLWYYGGLDGYYANYTYIYNNYRFFGSIAQQGGEHTRNPDIATNSREDGRSYGQMETAANDGNWVWASVDGYLVTDEGNLISPEPITVDPEPEPTTEFSVNVTITCVPESTGDNPYEPGGDAEPGGGGGTYDNVSDVIPRPPLPEIGIADGTFMAMFNPSQSELKDLADALFDTTIWTEAYRQIFGSPIDYIVSLTIAPLQPPITDEPVEFSLGASPFANISMYQITQQYVEVNCGTITIPEYWKAFLDYEPYSSIQIFLPYVGYRDLSPSEVLNKPLNVRYYIDLLTGACIAFVESDGTTLYQFDGNCLAQLPITAIQHTQIMSGMISALGFGATALATKGLGMFGKAGDFMLWGSGASAASSVVNAAKPTVTHGGNLTANQGLLGIQKPYCILRRPRQAIASEQNAFAGYATWYRSPNFLFTQGFTKVAEIHLENVPATEWEIREIERLLKEGVIF